MGERQPMSSVKERRVSAYDIVDWLERGAIEYSTRAAIEDAAGRALTYEDAARLSPGVQARLIAEGVRRGDRVGVLMRKSLDTPIAFQAVLRSGAVYVPADPLAPPGRAAFIFHDCGSAAVVVDEDLADGLRRELDGLGSRARLVVVPRRTTTQPSTIAAIQAPGSAAPVPRQPRDLAFLLYTSGSSGRPKAVVITHRNVVDFVDWCSDTFSLTPSDKIATQSPLQFSLTVFNLYAAWKHGASVVLIDEQTARVPQLLAPVIDERQITIWFSTPTILSLLAHSGELSRIRSQSLRLILYGGEPFPAGSLQALRAQLPGPRYFHILGSTETHMISAYELPKNEPITPSVPVPIGRVCDRFVSRIVDDNGQDVPMGVDGQLCLAGPGVTPGYWKSPADRLRAFFTDARGGRWYRTGDIVTVRPDGNLVYRGRRDRLIKKRGNRIELGEIETCLHRNADVVEAAVIAVADGEGGMQVQAFVVPRNGSTVTIIGLKTHCAKFLPQYMIPDVFVLRGSLPRTSTGKIDFPALKGMVRVA
jgi:amino acid adenylation domain-containing protein